MSSLTVIEEERGLFVPKAFKRHSASQISSYYEYPSQWLMQRFVGTKFRDSPDAARGKAVEHGINVFINGMKGVYKDDENNIIGANEPSECVAEAVAYFKSLTEQIADGPKADKVFKFLQTIGPCVMKGIESFREAYNPRHLSMQDEINGYLPGCEFPLNGKLDYVWAGNRVIDNKVTAKSPGGKLKQAYQIQGAIYQHFTGLPVEFHFIIPLVKSINVEIIKLTPAEYERGMRLAVEGARAIERARNLLEKMSLEDAMALFMPNLSGIFNEDERDETAKYFRLSKETARTYPTKEWVEPSEEPSAGTEEDDPALFDAGIDF